ncbi:hypothetical protein [Lactococcus lactis]|uniref:hypothetical protein n=1 Tax=Lactococcus lactis TaxID=1358 RepID=UPI00071E0A62|nr:hypothetical protein [Lactococcus lactis]KST98505.1 hypothetical protein KF196_1473 [Lactococcus lactis subsp. lactis]
MNNNISLNLKEIKEKINKYIGKVLGAFFIALIGFFFNKLISLLSHPTHLFYRNIYIKFYRYNFESETFWMVCLTFLIIGSITTFYVAVKTLIAKRYIKFSALFLLIVFFTYNCSTSISNILGVEENRTISTNIEIIHPYISDKEYVKLKSQYMQINSKQNFKAINNKIRNIVNENNANVY